MKTLKIFSIAVFAICLTNSSFAQVKTETFKVAGECGMCKKKIEKAAKEAGASSAAWNQETKELTVKYNSRSSNAAKIQKAIAGVGYDTPGFKATEEAYNKLHGCCQYEREAATSANCCDGETCGKACCAGGEASKDKDCCKKDESGKMDCCKDGKCSKEGHDGKDCCKKN